MAYLESRHGLRNSLKTLFLFYAKPTPPALPAKVGAHSRDSNNSFGEKKTWTWRGGGEYCEKRDCNETHLKILQPTGCSQKEKSPRHHSSTHLETTTKQPSIFAK